jgi:hypothetical protein
MVFSDSCLLSEGALTGCCFWTLLDFLILVDFTMVSFTCGDLSLATKGCFYQLPFGVGLKAFRLL